MKINQFIKTYCKALFLNKVSEQNIFKYGFKIHYTFIVYVTEINYHLVLYHTSLLFL